MVFRKSLVLVALSGIAYADTGFNPPSVLVSTDDAKAVTKGIQKIVFSTGTSLSISGSVATVGANGLLSSTNTWTGTNTFSSMTVSTQLNLPSMTSGSILFVNGSSVTQNNSNFYWDNSNYRVGIGTNVPTNMLHLRSTSNSNTATILLEGVNGLGNSGINFDISGPSGYTKSYMNTTPSFATGVAIGRNGEGATIELSPAYPDAYIRGHASSAAKLHIQSNDGSNYVDGIVLKAGNVGIATTNPTAPLEVSGGVRVGSMTATGSGGVGVNYGVTAGSYTANGISGVNTFTSSSTIFAASVKSSSTFQVIDTNAVPVLWIDNSPSKATDATWNVIASTSQGYAIQVSTSSAPPYVVQISTSGATFFRGTDVPANSQALCFLGGQLGHCTSTVGIAGGCTCVAP